MYILYIYISQENHHLSNKIINFFSSIILNIENEIQYHNIGNINNQYVLIAIVNSQ